MKVLEAYQITYSKEIGAAESLRKMSLREIQFVVILISPEGELSLSVGFYVFSLSSNGGWCSVVSVATRCGLYCPGFKILWG